MWRNLLRVLFRLDGCCFNIGGLENACAQENGKTGKLLWDSF